MIVENRKRKSVVLFVLSAFFVVAVVSCSINPDPSGGDGSTESGNGNGDSGDGPLPPGYVPPGWSDPTLAYAASEYFPAEVTDFVQAPGQYAKSSSFKIEGNEDKLLGPPEGGGTYSPDNSSIVSLGMAGGSVTVEFDPPIENHSDNIGGYDFIVFGNAYWSGGNPSSVWQEPGTIWVMKDEDGNGEPDDTWYLIPGSHLSNGDSFQDIEYSNTDDGVPPPPDKKDSWWPDGTASPFPIEDVFLLPDNLYNTDGGVDQCWGYVDAAPTMKLGDLSGAVGGAGENKLNDTEDYPEIDPVFFYTTPDTHGDQKIDAGSGGGNAIKLEWAVNPDTFDTEPLDEVSWIKIVSGTLLTDDTFGEYSCEVDAVARVRRSQ
jgi:hypothetical protein